jgi:hypothetical protein
VTRSFAPRAAALTVVAALALSACSTHPGSAAVVGPVSISQKQLDDVALALCSAQSGAAQAGAPQDLAGRAARQGALGVLLNSSLSKQYGESRGVQADQARISAAVSANQSTISALPPSRRPAFRQTLRDFAEAQLMMIAVGRTELTKKGAKSPTDQQALAAATPLRDAWVKKNLTVSVDPRYGRYSKGALASQSGSLSVPVSARAATGAKQNPGNSWVSALPASQKCS